MISRKCLGASWWKSSDVCFVADCLTMSSLSLRERGTASAVERVPCRSDEFVHCNFRGCEHGIYVWGMCAHRRHQKVYEIEGRASDPLLALRFAPRLSSP